MTKTALITGGSRGIGRACAIELAKAGCNVAITYAGNEAKANETLQELEKLGIKAKAYKFDIADRNAVKENIEAIHAEFGTVDILVNINIEKHTKYRNIIALFGFLKYNKRK